jgi:hypothetical protein
MIPPNLFSFATSELTQDAFLAYLLAWADPKVSKLDPAMHQTGTEFLRLLLACHNLPLTSVNKLEVRVQVKNIDVLVYLEMKGANGIALVIEDKVHAGSYNDLKKYLATGHEEYPAPTEVRGIYLRTGNQADYAAIEAVGFQVVNRNKMLTFLQDEQTGNPPNAIFQNYKAYLEDYQQRIEAYRELPLQQWNGDAWAGFFGQELLPNPGYLFADYGYVANASGGFQGAWWSPKNRPVFMGFTVYLQIDGSNTATETSRLAIKIETMDAKTAKEKGIDRLEIVRALADRIDQKPRNELLKITRPSRLRAGKWMTAAEVPLYGKDAPEDVADFLMMLDMMRNFVLRLGE